jgi:hypothetical protein
MKKGVVLMTVMVMVFLLSSVSYSEETKDVTILGITLGKSLRESGISECRQERKYSFKSYDYSDKDCYKEMDFDSSKRCFTTVRKELSFGVTIYATPLIECDRNSPIQEVQVNFKSDNYGKLLDLMLNKFGLPAKTEKSVVKNRMGATFDKVSNFWNISGHSIYLTNIGGKIDEGFLRVCHPDQVRRDIEKSRKEGKSDLDKF